MKPEERFAELWNDFLEGDLNEAGHTELRALLADHEALRRQAADLYQVHRLLGFAGSTADTDSFVQETLSRIPRGSHAFVQGVMQQLQRSQPQPAAASVSPTNVVPLEPVREKSGRLFGNRRDACWPHRQDACATVPGTSFPASTPAAEPRTAPIRPLRPWNRREWLAAAAALTVSTVGGALWWQQRQRLLHFARVTQNAGAVLALGGRPVPVRDSLPAGPLSLIQGTLGLNYGHGVQVVIEAPAQFECQNAESLLLHSGRLAAHVPPEAIGFTIETPRGRVIDRGTRFALDASPQASTQVHVFEGKVDALAHDASTDARRLVTGEALSLSHEIEPVQLRDGAFVHPEELPSVVAGLREGQRERWLAWRPTVQDDASLILFAELDPQRLAHGAVAARMSLAGTRPVQGRWPGKTCLDFNLQGDAVKLDVGGDRVWPQLTLAAWVRLDRLGEPYQSLYHTDDWRRGRPGQLHWMITRTAKMRLALQGNVIAGVPPEKPVYADADSSIPVLPERGRWVHLAVVYNSDTRTARFFLNGKLDNEVRHDVAHPAQLGSAQIGNWNKQDRKLSGRFDELIILGRALSDEELHAIYAAGNPYA